MELRQCGLYRNRRDSWDWNEVGGGLAHSASSLRLLVSGSRACANCIACTALVAAHIADVPTSQIVGFFEGVAHPRRLTRTLSKPAVAKAMLAPAANG